MVGRLLTIGAALMMMLGCQEYRVRNQGQPVAEPPGDEPDVAGDPPANWQDCPRGLQGYYYNLSSDHPYVAEGRVGMPLADVFADEMLSFDRYDPSLEFGEAWYPVDDAIVGDPDGFAVRWVGWLRGWSDSTLNLVLGASDDAEVLIDGEVVAQVADSEDLDLLLYTYELDGGVYPFEVRYGQRRDTSGMRFRLAAGDASLCIPSYAE